jgi:hypothetical protein
MDLRIWGEVSPGVGGCCSLAPRRSVPGRGGVFGPQGSGGSEDSEVRGVAVFRGGEAQESSGLQLGATRVGANGLVKGGRLRSG